jgi:hypothetical protein
MGSRSRSAGEPPGNPEEVLDSVFDFAENLIAQQRTFAKQVLRAASQGQQAIADVASTTSVPTRRRTYPPLGCDEPNASPGRAGR